MGFSVFISWALRLWCVHKSVNAGNLLHILHCGGCLNRRVTPRTDRWGGSGETHDWLTDSPLLKLPEVCSESCRIPMAVSFQVVWNLSMSLNPVLHPHSSSDLTGCVPLCLGKGPKSICVFKFMYRLWKSWSLLYIPAKASSLLPFFQHFPHQHGSTNENERKLYCFSLFQQTLS